MRVTNADVAMPWALPRSTMVCASKSAEANSRMNAPDPTFTSRTSESVPFRDLLRHDRTCDKRNRLDRAGHVAKRIELAIRRCKVTRRSGDDPPGETRSCFIRSVDSCGCQPAMASSLSSVPPVWPSPRPESCGTAAPQAATSGTRISEILSPTPPSSVCRQSADRRCQDERDARRHHGSGPMCQLVGFHTNEEDGHGQAQRLSSAISPAVYAERNQSIWSSLNLGTISFGNDDIERVHELPYWSEGRCSGPKAFGKRSASRNGPSAESRSKSGPPTSYSNCRHRPHGHKKLPFSPTTLMARSLLPPDR